MNYFKPREGSQIIRILPIAPKSFVNHFYKDKIIPCAKAKPKPSPCPLCEAGKPGQARYYLPIVDRRHPEDGVKLWGISKHLFNRIADEVSKPIPQKTIPWWNIFAWIMWLWQLAMGRQNAVKTILDEQEGSDFVVSMKMTGGFPDYAGSYFLREQKPIANPKTTKEYMEQGLKLMEAVVNPVAEWNEISKPEMVNVRNVKDLAVQENVAVITAQQKVRKFKGGDEVMVNEDNILKGMVGKITASVYRTNMGYIYAVRQNNTNISYDVQEDHLVLVPKPPTPKFKVGDQVMVIQDSILKGMVGKIIAEDHSVDKGCFYVVQPNQGLSKLTIEEADLKLAPDNKVVDHLIVDQFPSVKPPAMPLIQIEPLLFEVGNRVIVRNVTQNGHHYSDAKGIITKVASLYPQSYDIRLDVNQHVLKSVAPSSLSLLPDLPKFKAGDKVVFSNDPMWKIHERYWGKKGVVESVQTQSCWQYYYVQVEGDTIVKFHETNLRLEEPTPKFKAGDKVLILNHDKFPIHQNYRGHNGVIQAYCVGSDYLVRIEGISDPVRFNEANLKLTEKPTPKFKVSDKVVVENSVQNGNYRGKKSVVKKLEQTPSGDFLYKLRVEGDEIWFHENQLRLDDSEPMFALYDNVIITKEGELCGREAVIDKMTWDNIHGMQFTLRYAHSMFIVLKAGEFHHHFKENDIVQVFSYTNAENGNQFRLLNRHYHSDRYWYWIAEAYTDPAKTAKRIREDILRPVRKS